MPTYPGKSPAIRPPGGGGRNYGSEDQAPPIEVAVAPGEVALFSWLTPNDGWVSIVTLTGDAPETASASTAFPLEADSPRAGQGWLKGNGVYEFTLHGTGSLSVDIDVGDAWYAWTFPE